MKKFIHFLGLCVFASCLCSAQDSVEPYILPEAFGFRVSQNGEYVVAQDNYGAAIVYTPGATADEVLFYGMYYPGNGNCISDNGILVGQSMEDGLASIMINGVAQVPSTFIGSFNSSFDGITPDGSRVCGWIANINGRGLLDLPFYCDVTENGTVGSPNILPYPEKDLFGDTPQYCTAVWISNDGKRIAGMVVDGTGFYSYPIVYLQDDSGTWTYTLPSEPISNPDHLEAPDFPEDNVGPSPQMTDFMTPENRDLFLELMEEYRNTGDPDLDPMAHIDDFISDEEYAAFEDALRAYNDAMMDYYAEIDKYWEIMAEIANGARFAPNIAFNPQGTLLMADLGVSGDNTTTDNMEGYIPYLFNIDDNTYTELDTKYTNLLPSQILSDGTMVAWSAPLDMVAYRSFVKLPDAEDFMTFDEYLSAKNPSFLPWVKENFEQNMLVGYDSETGQYIYDDVVISGIVTFSENMDVIAGGIPFGDMITYIFTDANSAAVEKPWLAEREEVYEVYNLSGIRVMNTTHKSELSSLPKGLYIINGKKVVIK